ncbi:hypothetical protein B0H13DRAFT_1907599 [Mycena leptocephala]|nr:hypothetical protein B0H13DRAFT_1907599 [Mycena leptocephala]
MTATETETTPCSPPGTSTSSARALQPVPPHPARDVPALYDVCVHGDAAVLRVPIFNCQEYYNDPVHPPYDGPASGDACAVTAIDSRTAKDIAVMITLTTCVPPPLSHRILSNLTCVAGSAGGRSAGDNNHAEHAAHHDPGRRAGYLLSVNSYMAEVVEPEERTPRLGVGGDSYVGRGECNDLIGLSAPFKSPSASSWLDVFTALCLPYVPPGGFPVKPDPDAPTSRTQPPKSRRSRICVRLPALPADLPPSEVRGRKGKGRFWGLPLLVSAPFAVDAPTHCDEPVWIQTGDNGFLCDVGQRPLARRIPHARVPALIAWGRKVFAQRTATDAPPVDVLPAVESLLVVESVGDPVPPAESEGHNLKKHGQHGSAFDLAFLRYSMIIDAFLVALLVFSTSPAHIWAGALILPLASGTAPACKGVLLDMTTAMILTVSLYGALFALLSDLGRPNLVFLFNALTALLSAGVLFAVRFPRGALASAER